MSRLDRMVWWHRSVVWYVVVEGMLTVVLWWWMKRCGWLRGCALWCGEVWSGLSVCKYTKICIHFKVQYECLFHKWKSLVSGDLLVGGLREWHRRQLSRVRSFTFTITDRSMLPRLDSIWGWELPSLPSHATLCWPWDGFRFTALSLVYFLL